MSKSPAASSQSYPDDLLSIIELERELDGLASKSTIRRRVDDGSLRAYKVNGMIRVSVADARAFFTPLPYDASLAAFQKVSKCIEQNREHLSDVQRASLVALLG